MADKTPDANALVDEIGKDPTLDLYFDRNPKTLTDDELRQLIDVEPRNRAAFIRKKGK